MNVRLAIAIASRPGQGIFYLNHAVTELVITLYNRWQSCIFYIIAIDVKRPAPTAMVMSVAAMVMA